LLLPFQAVAVEHLFPSNILLLLAVVQVAAKIMVVVVVLVGLEQALV
jgi:hypothetical protein